MKKPSPKVLIKKYCLDCGVEKSLSGKYCKRCGYKHRVGAGYQKGHKLFPGSEKGWFKVGVASVRKGKVGHVAWNKGIIGSVKANKTSYKIGENVGELNHRWKGNKVGYHALHRYVYKKFGVPDKCEKCNACNNVQWASKNYKYTRNREDWIKLCFLCHRKYDMINGWGIATKLYPEIVERKVCHA